MQPIGMTGVRPRGLALLLLPLILAAAVLIGWRGGHPPAVRAGDVAEQFSVARATALVENIARAPHVAGSPEHARVREALVTTLRGMGLEVTVQSSFGVRQFSRFGQAISASPVENIIAVLPGRDRAQPGVAMMAHYDSVSFALAASDDAAGTAAVIESARVLRAGSQPLRDVYFVITDAEELGLVGAHVFFSESPFAARIGAVVNMEARGSRGLATMFQTSAGNASLIELWAQSAVAPSGNSLTGAVYRLLPNDTDMTVALAAGKTGINAAFVDGQFDYHSPTDTPANLDKRTLQQLGDFALTTTRALAFAKTLPAPGGDSAYFDVFGLGVVRYPMWVGWGLLAVGVIGFATLPFARLGTSLGAAALGVLRVLLVTALGAGLCQLLATLIYGEGTTALRERLAEGPAALWMFLAACLAVLMLARTCSALWLGSIGLLLIIGLAAQLFLPGANWLFVWPALVAVVLAHIGARVGLGSRSALALTAIIGGLVLALVAQLVLVAYVGLGSMTPIVVALIVPFTIVLTGPLLIVWTEARWSPRGCVAALVVAMGLAGNFALTDGFSARQPRPGDLFHLSDDAGRSWWATSSSPAELPAGKAARVDIPASSRFKVWGVPAPRLGSPRPQFAFASRSGAMKLQITTAQTGRLLLMSLRPSVALADVRINGKPVKLAPGRWTPLGMRAAVPANLVIKGKAAQPGNLEIRYLSAVDSLPSEAPRAAGPPTNWTPLSGGRAVMGTVRFALR